MERLLRDTARIHLLARLSMISAVLSVFLVIGSILLLWYVPMGIFIALAVHGFYMTPFYYRRYEDLTRLTLILDMIGRGASEKELSETAFVSEEHVRRLINLARRRGYASAVSCDTRESKGE